jgi:hypothetical protein
MEHPAEETLRRFRRGEGSPAENREVVAHLLRGCKICSEIVREAIQPETPSVRGRAAEPADDPPPGKPSRLKPVGGRPAYLSG